MRNKVWILSLLGLGLLSCAESVQQQQSPPKTIAVESYVIPKDTVEKSALVYDRNTSQWTLEGQLYSGYVVNYYKNKRLKERFGLLEGRMQDEAVLFYPNGHLKRIAHYHKGKLHGAKKLWSADSPAVLLAALNYHMGKGHGEQKKWYPSGELFKKLNLNMGREEGIQQAFRKNGVLFANYEARDGRIFGLKKAVLCFDLEEEKFVVAD